MQDGKVKIKYINTADNLADLFTKPVGKTTLQRARQGLGLKAKHDAVDRQPPALPLREAVEGNETKQGSRPDTRIPAGITPRSLPAHARVLQRLRTARIQACS